MSGGRKKPGKMPRYEMDEAAAQAKVVRQMNTYNRVKLNAKQKELYDGIVTNTITTVKGQAGTGKTFVACYAALAMFYDPKSKIDKIYLVKPLETSSEQTGFLPGTLKDKVEPYMQSFVDNFTQMMDGSEFRMMMESRTIEFVPAAYARGRTLRNCVVIIDESQNFDVKQLMTLVTRLGDNNRMVFLGDQRQNDINKRNLAFNFFIERILEGVGEVFRFEFGIEDIVRRDILKRITENYERLEDNGELPQTKRFN